MCTGDIGSKIVLLVYRAGRPVAAAAAAVALLMLGFEGRMIRMTNDKLDQHSKNTVVFLWCGLKTFYKAPKN